MKKSNYRNKIGFKKFKIKLYAIFGGDVICITKAPKATETIKGKKFEFQCTKCGHNWNRPPSQQLTTKPNRKKPPSCSKCGGSHPKTKNEIEQILKELNIEPLEGLKSIKKKDNYSVRKRFCYKCKKCKTGGNLNLNQLVERKKKKYQICECSARRHTWTLEKLRSEGLKNGFKLIGNPKKIDYNEKFKWKCQKKTHITYFTIQSLKNGCNKCYNEKKFTSLADIENFLTQNTSNLKIASGQEWIGGGSSRYHVKCQVCEKEFSKSFYNLIKTPRCIFESRSYSEIIVQFFLEELLNIKFIINKKYSFLKNSEGNKMELDGYNEENKIAFEHHGIQHYKENGLHRGNNNLKRRKLDDSLKEKQCKKMGIRLIIIPALGELTPLDKLKEKIKDELLRLNIKIPKNFDKFQPDYSKMTTCFKKRKYLTK